MRTLKWPDWPKSSEEALKLAQSLLPDVIITDITMPRMNGLDFLEKISAACCRMQGWIVLSGYDRFEYARQALRIGVRGYLLKPLDTTKLLAILEKFKKSWIRAEGRWGPWQEWTSKTVTEIQAGTAVWQTA